MLSRSTLRALAAALACCPAAASDLVQEFRFSSDGVSKVVVRAANATAATVSASEPAMGSIVIYAKASGGAAGYHSPDPNWKETPASGWGLAFVSQRFGPVLVISSKNEIQYIHHRYSLTEIKIQVPAGVAVVTEKREPSGDGTPDLAAP